MKEDVVMENNRAKNISDEPNEFQSYECLNHFRTPLIKEIIRTLEIPCSSKGLDAGCGLGFTTRLLVEMNSKSIQLTGMDISNDCIEYASTRYQANNIQYVKGDVNSMPFNDQKALKILFHMLWDESDSILNERERKLFSALTNEQSDQYILHDPNYCGFYTYTLFKGIK